MPGLGETTAALRRLRSALAAAEPRERPGFQETAAFGKNPGGLRMLTYAPTRLRPAAPLLVVLHGCAQSATGFATSGGWCDLADRLGCALLAPEQSPNNNFNRCFNWFTPDDTQRGLGEAASLASMVRHATRQFGSDPQRVFIMGLSAGGAMAVVMLATYPELFAAGGVVAGLPYGVARSLPDAMRIMHRADAMSSEALGDRVRKASPGGGRMPRLTVWHGDSDWTVDRADGLAVARQWADVLGLGEVPDETAEFAKFSRSTWLRPGSKQAAVEFNLVYDLGHGAPLSTVGPDALGAAAPFMLEAGVSSTLEMARFWDILTTSAVRPSTRAKAAPKTTSKARARRISPPVGAVGEVGLGRQVLGSLAKVVSDDITDVVAKAFKSAGLLKK